MEAHDLVEIGPVALDGVEAFASEFLDELGAGSLVFDQHDPCPVQLLLLPHRALEVGIIHAAAQDMEEVGVPADDAPGRADAEVAELGCLVGRVPALNHLVEPARQVAKAVGSEPFQKRRPLTNLSAASSG